MKEKFEIISGNDLFKPFAENQLECLSEIKGGEYQSTGTGWVQSGNYNHLCYEYVNLDTGEPGYGGIIRSEWNR
jgi:hypothetical protein